MTPKRTFGRKLGIFLGLVALVFVAIQFVRPRLDNPPITGDLVAPPDVKAVLKRACYDCHSNETRLAWFDQLEPAYWLVVDHIKKGRAVLNFSNWDALTKDQQKGKLFESLNQMVFNVMPLQQYTMVHTAAKLTPADLTVLKDYLGTLVQPLKMADTGANARALAASTSPAPAGSHVSPHLPSGMNVAPVANGLAYIPGWPDWQAISTTDRFDNGTMRVIYGNDVAVKAVKDHKTNPWPNGATFAKVAWDQALAADGKVHPGKFIQVEFMVKDAEKYKTTYGWGFGRWKGTDLKPYGKDALFTTECMNCHKPMQDNDYVFTTPINPVDAALPDPAAFNPLEWKVITSSVNKTDGSMSTLYGNELAARAARAGGGQPYPAGAVLAWVSWLQREDEHWYGANIPGAIRSIEKVTFINASNTPGQEASYDSYVGSPLRKIIEKDPVTVRDRVTYIGSLRNSVLP